MKKIIFGKWVILVPVARVPKSISILDLTIVINRHEDSIVLCKWGLWKLYRIMESGIYSI